MNICHHRNFATLTVCSLERWLLSLERNLCMRGCHVYNDIWEAAVGETMVCVRESKNAHDRYTVAVEKDGTVIGHLL